MFSDQPNVNASKSSRAQKKGTKRKQGNQQEEEQDDHQNSIVNDEEAMQDGDEELLNVGQDYVDYDDGTSESGPLIVDFDVNVPDLEKDYFGVELYVRNYLQGNEFNYVEMTELLLGDEQNKIPNPLTSVIKTANDNASSSSVPSNTSNKAESSEQKSQQATSSAMKDDDEVDPSQWDWTMDMYGLVSLLDYKLLKKKQCMKQIKAFVLQKCADKDKYAKLCEVFDNSKLGIIVNERVINLPYEVGGMLHENLFEELEREQKENNFTKFQYYLILTKVFHMKSPLAGQVKKVKDEALFYKPEEQFYYERAFVSFTYPIKSDYTEDSSTVTLTDDTFQQGLCMIIESSKMRKILKKIKDELIPNSNNAAASTTNDNQDE
ncbi:hypothetical protein C9374_006654 [Naegleria lovaniensis]|uniref:Uncharacterized protein n=1 Tax=Naegleria lovaniensis TaxID=51637 RepID=A0AA88GHI3_NAELO|nr:uncharacterized protein C9374_006654 [Naegleria lovaniensis]KAG2379537.1 hypothetical protein C9374_006654 [Naegleria lovaniensis]